MVHIARGALDRADQVLREGVVVQDRQVGRRERFPARGLRWLLGLTRLARGATKDAIAEFEREIAGGGSRLYAREFGIAALNGWGQALLAAGDAAGAVDRFRRALDLYDEHARSLVGLAAALTAQGLRAEAEPVGERARAAIEELRRGGRVAEAALADAFFRVTEGRRADAVPVLDRLLAGAPPGFAGWTIPVEPWTAPLRAEPAFQQVLERLKQRAA